MVSSQQQLTELTDRIPYVKSFLAQYPRTHHQRLVDQILVLGVQTIQLNLGTDSIVGPPVQRQIQSLIQVDSALTYAQNDRIPQTRVAFDRLKSRISELESELDSLALPSQHKLVRNNEVEHISYADIEQQQQQKHQKKLVTKKPYRDLNLPSGMHKLPDAFGVYPKWYAPTPQELEPVKKPPRFSQPTSSSRARQVQLKARHAHQLEAAGPLQTTNAGTSTAGMGNRRRMVDEYIQTNERDIDRFYAEDAKLEQLSRIARRVEPKSEAMHHQERGIMASSVPELAINSMSPKPQAEDDVEYDKSGDFIDIAQQFVRGDFVRCLNQ